MAGPGRPSKFDTIPKAQMERLAKAGWTDVQMAEFFDIAPDTLTKWKKSHPGFFLSLTEWKEEADKRVERSLYERACGYSHKAVKIFKPAGEEPTIVEYTEHYPPDTTACIFWLKNRDKARWRDRVDHEVSGPGGGPVEVHNLTDAELDARLAALEAKNG